MSVLSYNGFTSVMMTDNHLLHLDPHYSQAVVNMSLPDFSISVSPAVTLNSLISLDGSFPQSYHCRTPKKLLVSKMDPSCTLGFYCHSMEDFNKFVLKAKKV